MAGLNKSEFDSLVGLLARAHYHGDTAMLEQHVAKAYGLVKGSGVPGQDLPMVGAMTDGSKRRLTPDSVNSLEGFDGFEFVEDPEEILARKLELDAICDEMDSADSAKVPPFADWTLRGSGFSCQQWWNPWSSATREGSIE